MQNAMQNEKTNKQTNKTEKSDTGQQYGKSRKNR